MAMNKNSRTSKMKKKSDDTGIYIKCVRQYSIPIADEDFAFLMHDAAEYHKCRNYIYSRFSGINSLQKLKHHRQLIRDRLRKTDEENKRKKREKFVPVMTWELSARLRSQAIDDAVGDIKSAQSNTINRVREIVRRHDRLTEDEKHFCYWVLCNETRLYHVLKRHTISYPEEIWNLNVDRHNLLNRIRRWYRKKKNWIPYTNNSTSYMIDMGLYRYGKDRLGTYIDIGVSQRPGKRIRVYLRDNAIVSKGTLRIILDPKTRTISIRRIIRAKAKKQSAKEKKTVFVNVVGADKGMTEMLHLSNGHVYGTGLGKLVIDESDWIKSKWQKRNLYDVRARNLEEEGKVAEANRLREEHLGRLAYDRHREKFSSTLKTFINAEIRRMILTENLSEIILEDLTWVSSSLKKPKNMNRRLHHWLKGYLQERLEYYAKIYGVKITMVNPAYTSKVCHICGCSGVREGKVFTCPHCGKMDADDNAAKNIKSRKGDEQITLHTSKIKVKNILESRYWKQRNKTLPVPLSLVNTCFLSA